MYLWIVLVAPALAHLPHDVVSAAALAPAPGLPSFAILGDGRTQVLFRSDDDGRTWAPFAADPQVDELVGVAVTADGVVWLGAADRLWRSEDGGATWSAAAPPARVRGLAGSEVLALATDAGLRVADGEGWLALGGAAITALAGGEEATAALDAAGTVWVGRDGAWEALDGAPGGVLSVAADSDTAWLGDGAGRLWRHDAGPWTTCAPLPPDALSTPAGLVRLAAGGGEVYAATAAGELWRTDGRCAAWERVPSPAFVLYDGDGAAHDASEATTALALRGDHMLQAGWSGLSLAEGATWWSPVLVPPDYTRGLEFSPQAGASVSLWVGGYAAGVLRTDDGGASWTASTGGLDAPNVQRVLFPADLTEPDLLLSIAGHAPFRSRDGGDRWQALSPPLGSTAELWAWGEERLWAADDDGALVVSGDGGETWAPDEALEAALDGARPRNLAHLRTDDGRSLLFFGAADPARVLLGEALGEAGESWTVAREGPADSELAGPVPWPQAAPRAVVVADAEGVHRSLDGRTWNTWDGLGEDSPRQLVSLDQSLFLVTRTNRLWRSDDGGLSFRDLGLRFDSTVHTLRGRPGFRAHPELLVGTHDGVFLVADALGDEARAERFAPYQRVDDAALDCEACLGTVTDPDAGLGGRAALGDGGRLRVTVRGEWIRVRGRADRGGEGELWVDGAFVTDLGRGGREELLAELDGLPFGWHEVELRGRAEGVEVDAVEAGAAGAGLDVAPPERCGGGGLALLVLVPGLGALRRRGKGQVGALGRAP